MTTSSRTVLSDRIAVLVRRTITLAVLVIAALAFAFSYGNGLSLGIQLGVPKWIAGLISPSVDLTTLTLLIAIHHIRSQQIPARLYGPRAFLGFAGSTTLIINTAQAIAEHRYGRAAFDAVAPALLILWGEVGPSLLALLHSAGPTVQNEAGTVRDEAKIVPHENVPSLELVAAARQLDAAHRVEANRPITRDGLRAQLHVSSAVASDLIRIVRTVPNGGDPP